MFSAYLFLTPIENSHFDINLPIEDDEFSCLKAKEEMKSFIKYSLSISRPESINLTNNSHLSMKRLRKERKSSWKESEIKENQLEKEKFSKMIISNWKSSICLLKKKNYDEYNKENEKNHKSFIKKKLKISEFLNKSIGNSYENVY